MGGANPQTPEQPSCPLVSGPHACSYRNTFAMDSDINSNTYSNANNDANMHGGRSGGGVVVVKDHSCCNHSSEQQ